MKYKAIYNIHVMQKLITSIITRKNFIDFYRTYRFEDIFNSKFIEFKILFNFIIMKINCLLARK